MELLQYLVMTGFVTAVVTYFVLMSLQASPFPPDADDNDGGGFGSGGNLPIVDIPPGSSISFLLTDRLHSPERSPVAK